MARLLVDEDLPQSLNVLLREKGHESAHIVELGLRGATDTNIFKVAQERGAVLVSRDLGFATPSDTRLELTAAWSSCVIPRRCGCMRW